MNDKEKEQKFQQLKQTETKFNKSIQNFPKSKSPIPSSNLLIEKNIDTQKTEIKSSNALDSLKPIIEVKNSLINNYNNLNTNFETKSKVNQITHSNNIENNSKSNNFYVLNRNLNKKLTDKDKEENDKLGYLEDNKNLYNLSQKQNNFLNTDIEIARNTIQNSSNSYKYDIMSGKIGSKIDFKQNNLLMNSSSASKMFPNINKSLSPKQIQYNNSNNNFTNSIMKSQSPTLRIDINKGKLETKLNKIDLKSDINSKFNSNAVKSIKIDEKSSNIKLINGLSPTRITSNNPTNKFTNDGKIKTIKMDQFIVKDKNPVSIVSPKNFSKNQANTSSKLSNLKSLSPVNKNLDYSNNLSKLIYNKELSFKK